MDENFSFHDFLERFPDDEACLEEIKKLQYPKGVFCKPCRKITKHYKINNRTSYSCKVCRTHVYPLAGTILEKSSTPLRLWFYTFFLVTQTRGEISAKLLQRELGVTYKTAWRMYRSTYDLMEMNNRDLLSETETKDQKKSGLNRWSFFYKVEYDEVQKDE
jgi:hypothetical protein